MIFLLQDHQDDICGFRFHFQLSSMKSVSISTEKSILLFFGSIYFHLERINYIHTWISNVMNRLIWIQKHPNVLLIRVFLLWSKNDKDQQWELKLQGYPDGAPMLLKFFHNFLENQENFQEIFSKLQQFKKNTSLSQKLWKNHKSKILISHSSIPE